MLRTEANAWRGTLRPGCSCQERLLFQGKQNRNRKPLALSCVRESFSNSLKKNLALVQVYSEPVSKRIQFVTEGTSKVGGLV